MVSALSNSSGKWNNFTRYLKTTDFDYISFSYSPIMAVIMEELSK